jgi:hypothetical protein
MNSNDSKAFSNNAITPYYSYRTRRVPRIKEIYIICETCFLQSGTEAVRKLVNNALQYTCTNELMGSVTLPDHFSTLTY